MKERSKKPLGHRAYGSIPHLPGSNRGPGDHGLQPKQAALLTEAASKDWTVVVQEKLDGSCLAVAKISGRVVPLGRAGYDLKTSPYEHLRAFDQWVADRHDRFDRLLGDGERVVGEWMLKATSLVYDIESEDALWVAFDLMRKHDRAPSAEVRDRVRGAGLLSTPIYHVGGPISAEDAYALVSGWRCRPVVCEESPEGVVYRAEKAGAVRFLGKWVRGDFEPGRHLDADVGNRVGAA